jgi:hypothetical protein
MNNNTKAKLNAQLNKNYPLINVIFALMTLKRIKNEKKNTKIKFATLIRYREKHKSTREKKN